MIRKGAARKGGPISMGLLVAIIGLGVGVVGLVIGLAGLVEGLPGALVAWRDLAHPTHTRPPEVDVRTPPSTNGEPELASAPLLRASNPSTAPCSPSWIQKAEEACENGRHGEALAILAKAEPVPPHAEHQYLRLRGTGRWGLCLRRKGPHVDRQDAEVQMAWADLDAAHRSVGDMKALFVMGQIAEACGSLDEAADLYQRGINAGQGGELYRAFVAGRDRVELQRAERQQ